MFKHLNHHHEKYEFVIHAEYLKTNADFCKTCYEFRQNKGYMVDT
jgi:hypothetical protein